MLTTLPWNWLHPPSSSLSQLCLQFRYLTLDSWANDGAVATETRSIRLWVVFFCHIRDKKGCKVGKQVPDMNSCGMQMRASEEESSRGCRGGDLRPTQVFSQCFNYPTPRLVVNCFHWFPLWDWILKNWKSKHKDLFLCNSGMRTLQMAPIFNQTHQKKKNLFSFFFLWKYLPSLKGALCFRVLST